MQKMKLVFGCTALLFPAMVQGSCSGSPVSCDSPTIEDYSDCYRIDGCRVETSTSSAECFNSGNDQASSSTSCYPYSDNAAECLWTGCTYRPEITRTYCTGRPSPCSSFGRSSSCTSQPGCFWSNDTDGPSAGLAGDPSPSETTRSDESDDGAPLGLIIGLILGFSVLVFAFPLLKSRQQTRQGTNDNPAKAAKGKKAGADLEMADVDSTESIPDRMEESTEKQGKVIAKIYKRTKEERLGITLKRSQRGGPIVVSEISATSPFADTALEVGMRIRTINGAEVTGKERAIILIKESLGEVLVIAEKVPEDNDAAPAATNRRGNNTAAAITTKPATATTPNETTEERAYIDPTESIPDRTESVEQPKKVNNSDETSSSAAPPMPWIVATVTKETVNQKLGITMARNPKGHFIISMLSPSSPFSIMGLEVGMRVMSINDIDITGQPVSVAIMLLKESIGDVTLAAEEVPEGGADLEMAY